RNPASAELFGSRSSARDVFEDASDRPGMLAELLAAGFVDAFETVLVRGDDTPFPGQVSARLVEYGGEEVIVSSATDMTQLYAQRDELARQREASFQNEKLTALGELLAGVAHELNNPLSVVVGQALMLREETEGSDLSRRVEKISQSAERCAKIVKTFLAMARQKPARLEPVSMNAVVETAVDVAGYGIRSAGGEVILDLAPDLPLAKADEDQIAQVLINLLINAEQATADGGVSAQVTLKTWVDEDASLVNVSVSDNGPGIAPAARARLFEPFFTTKKEGAGAGLALCHRIVAGHNGRLEVSDAPSGGAQFTLVLPRADWAGLASGGPSDAVAPALHALVVDDEADVAEMLSDMLDSLGVRSTIAHSAEDAVAALTEGLAPNLVLSDFVMPGLGGEGLLRAIRRDWPQLSKRVAFVTGDSLSSDAQELGLPVLEKPVAPHDLRNLLRDLID
ncbi:MAG: ATP-binding protein, partial [Pseudomonadota bacterium]